MRRSSTNRPATSPLSGLHSGLQSRAGFGCLVLIVALLLMGQAAAVPPQYEDLFAAAYNDPAGAMTRIKALPAEEPTDQDWRQFLMARAFYYQNRFADSLSELITLEAPEPELASRADRLAGQNYYWLGSLNQALIQAHKARDTALRIQLPDEVANAENLIAAIHMKNGERPLALEFFQRALTYFEDQGSKMEIAKVRNNIGVLHIEEGNLDQAEPFVQAALSLGRELERPSTMVAALVNLIEIRTRQSRFDDAKRHLDACETVAKAQGEGGFLVWCREAEVQTLAAAGELPAAIAAARDVLDRADSQGLSQTGVDMARQLGTLLAENGDHTEALQYADRAFSDMLKINEDLLALRVGQVDDILAAEASRRELTTLRVQNEFQRQRQWLLAGGLAVLTPLLIWAVMLVRSKQQLVDALNQSNQRTEAALKSTSDAKAAVERLARTDPLTGLNNRRAALASFKSAHARWLKDHRAYSVLLLDLDHFKQVNDQHGHAAGDQVLVGVASILNRLVPEAASSCRWGGEEFLVLIPLCADVGARTLAETIRAETEQLAVAAGDQPLRPTVSIGVATVGTGDSIDEVIRAADRAMYQAKQQGRNRVV